MALCVFIILCVIGGFNVFSASLDKIWSPDLSLKSFSVNTILGTLIFSLSLYQLFRLWLIRQQHYTINSISQITLTGITLGSQVIWVRFNKPDSTGLILGTLFGQIAGISVMVVGIIRRGCFPSFDRQILRDVPLQLKKWKRFPQFIAPYTLLGLIQDRAVLFILNIFTGSIQVGLYAFAYRIINFPVTLISEALRPVLFKSSASQGVKSIENQIKEIHIWLVIFSMPLLVIYFFVAEKFFGLFFGPEWAQAGYVGKFIILPIYLFLFVNWMDRIMDVLGEQRAMLVLQTILTTTSILFLLIGFILGLRFEYALALQAIVVSIFNIFYLIIVYDKARFEKSPLRKLLGIGLISAAISLGLVFIAGAVFKH